MADIELIRTPALGDNSYVLISGDVAAITDPQRDAWPRGNGPRTRPEATPLYTERK